MAMVGEEDEGEDGNDEAQFLSQRCHTAPMPIKKNAGLLPMSMRSSIELMTARVLEMRSGC